MNFLLKLLINRYIFNILLRKRKIYEHDSFFTLVKPICRIIFGEMLGF